MAYQDTIHHPVAGDAEHKLPRVRSITPRDLVDALAKGFDDFLAMPTHVVFLSLIYPLAGLVIAGLSFSYDLLPLLYPMATGFALIGLVLTPQSVRKRLVPTIAIVALICAAL